MNKIALLILLCLAIPKLVQGQKQARGKIVNGVRTGIWEFYASNQLEQKYDFSKKQLLFTTDTGRYCSIRQNDEWVLTKVDRRPILIGGIQNLIDSLALKVLPQENNLNPQEGVIITFVVDTAGEAGNFHVLSSSQKVPDTETINYAIYRLSNFWVPALLGGRKVEAHLNMPIGAMYY